jgi:hypothetical protein
MLKARIAWHDDATDRRAAGMVGRAGAGCPAEPQGGRPAMDKRQALRGIFWVLDNGAKRKDLPRQFGAKSAVHKYFMQWVRAGVFENMMRDVGELVGELVGERGGCKLYECFIGATFSKARGGGDGIGVAKAGKDVKIMVLVDARGLPVAVDTASATPHECKLVQGLFDFMPTLDAPRRIIGDKAYDSDVLDDDLAQEGIGMIAPQELQAGERHAGRPRPAEVQASLDGRTHDQLVPELPPPLHSLREVHHPLPRLPPPRMLHHPPQTGLRIGSTTSPAFVPRTTRSRSRRRRRAGWAARADRTWTGRPAASGPCSPGRARSWRA